MSKRRRPGQGSSSQRSFGQTVFLLFATIGWGLAIRFAPLGLPHVVVKYGGSALWALTIYWVVSSVTPLQHSLRAAAIAACAATAVEFFKLVHTPWLEALRRTLPGVLLLGRHFSLRDLLAYWSAVLVGFAVDRYLLR